MEVLWRSHDTQKPWQERLMKVQYVALLHFLPRSDLRVSLLPCFCTGCRATSIQFAKEHFRARSKTRGAAANGNFWEHGDLNEVAASVERWWFDVFVFDFRSSVFCFSGERATLKNICGNMFKSDVRSSWGFVIFYFFIMPRETCQQVSTVT